MYERDVTIATRSPSRNTRYVIVPGRLSTLGFQERLTRRAPIDVAFRPVGVLGGVRSGETRVAVADIAGLDVASRINSLDLIGIKAARGSPASVYEVLSGARDATNDPSRFNK